jgi:hypothetical protein
MGKMTSNLVEKSLPIIMELFQTWDFIKHFRRVFLIDDILTDDISIDVRDTI